MLRHLFAMILAASLAACASNPPVQEDPETYTRGRSLYLAGEYERAFPLIFEAANTGHPEAQYAIGYMFYLGQGVDQNAAEGIEWIRLAAKAGEPRAIEALSLLAGRQVPNQPAE